MTTMSDLPEDLVAEILSKVPITSLSAVRSTCKKWNVISKNWVVGKDAVAAARKQFLGFMMKDYRVCSLRFDLHGIRNDGDLVDPSIKQVSILNQVEISQVFHCDGLLLCVTGDKSRLVVWNPYLGQTKWIQPIDNFIRFEISALGYDNKNRNHKILTILVDDRYCRRYEIYDFSSNSWSVLDVTPDWNIASYQRGVSMNGGNTYLFAKEKVEGKGKVDKTQLEDFLLCFDFTTESFGPRLRLPIQSYDLETVTLSCVREEQLALLYQRSETSLVMEIWVTTKIEPNVLSWSKFLEVDMEPLTGFPFDYYSGSFFIDEEKKVAVVFDLDGNEEIDTCRYQTVYIIGQDGYFKSVNIGEAPDLGKPEKLDNGYKYCVPLVCSSYVPSLVELER